MKWFCAAIVFFISLTIPPQHVLAAEFFVSKTGNDTHTGQSPDQAFATIQKGVDALSPGDTLTIAPGEYRETVKRANLGSPDVQTTIRAAIPGSVLLRGDVPAPAFTKVDGKPFIYVADFKHPVQAVIEVDTLRLLDTSPSIVELSFTPGKCFHDEVNGKLYISTSDLQSADLHHYTISITPDHGLYLDRPVRVTIDGLAATGYHAAGQLEVYPFYRAAWGIYMNEARHCVIRNATAYLNGGGLGINQRQDPEAGHNRIEYSTAYANFSRHSGEGGNLIIFAGFHDTIDHCLAHSGLMQGLRIYGSIRGPVTISNSIAWGNEAGDIWIKGGKGHTEGIAHNNVGLGNVDVTIASRNLIGRGNQYNRTDIPLADNISLIGETMRLGDEKAQALQQQDFADPLNLDYRLQSTSRYRNAAADGSDRGAYPYKPNVYYLNPQGNDQADGLSTSTTWRSLDHAIKQLTAGDTLYLEAGAYTLSSPLRLQGTADEPIAIRGRGHDEVIITTDLSISDTHHVTFERLNFTGKIHLARSSQMAWNNCRFLSKTAALQAEDVDHLRITHGLFTGFTEPAIQLTRSTNVHLTGNLLDNAHAVALATDQSESIAYSDYNAYQNPQALWKIKDQILGSEQKRVGLDGHSLFAQPEFQMHAASPIPTLTNEHMFAGRGPLGTAVGIYHAFRQKDMHLHAPHLHSVSDTTANLEWMASVPAEFELAWGTTPACENIVQMTSEAFTSFSLTGLTPGQTYFFKINSATPVGYANALTTKKYINTSTPISFTLNRTPHEAKVYHVAVDGDDDHSGLSPQKAWRTLQHAANQVNAGDTVLLAQGSYTENVRLRATGTPNAPITFKAMPGKRVDLSGNKRLINNAFQGTHKHHLIFDSLYFSGFGSDRGGRHGVFTLIDSSNITLSRCFMNGMGPGYSNPFISFVGDKLTLRNCVIGSCFFGMRVTGPGSVHIQHCVFLRNMIQACILTNEQGGDIHHNIFVDSGANKVTSILFEIPLGLLHKQKFFDNAFHFRVPDAQRQAMLFYGNNQPLSLGSPSRYSIERYAQETGNTGNVMVDPLFQILVDHKPVDKEGKPLPYTGDWVATRLLQGLDFNDLFTTHPELLEKKIGLIPKDFADFHFHSTQAADAATSKPSQH